MRHIVGKLIGTYLRIVSEDELVHFDSNFALVLIILSLLQRSVLFLKSWGLKNQPYQDIKLKYLTQIFNFCTGSSIVSDSGADSLNLIIIYLIYLAHLSAFLIGFSLSFGRKYFSKQLTKTFERLLYIYFSFFQAIFLVPSILFLARQLICEKGNLIFKDNSSCQALPQLVNGPILVFLLLYQSFIFVYVLRNIALPVQNYFKRRYNTLNYLILFLEFPSTFLQQYTNSTLYALQSIVKIFLMICYFIDAFYLQPFHSRINRVYIAGASVLLYLSILFLIVEISHLKEDLIFYLVLIISPLVGNIAVVLHEAKGFQNNQYFITAWIDQYHEITEILKKDSSYLIKWIQFTNQHKMRCLNKSCNKKLDVSDFSKLIKTTHRIVICNLNKITKDNSNSKQNQEMIQLYLVNYLSNECQTPLKGYIQLKKFELQEQDKSLYWQLMSQYISIKLDFKIKQFQEVKFWHILKNTELEKISIKQILDTESLWQKLYPLILKVVQEKIKFWLRLLGGYQQIEEFQQSSEQLAQKIWQVKDEIFKNIKVDPKNIHKCLTNKNMMELKILQAVYSIVLNDFYGTIDIQHKIDEIYQIERNSMQDNVVNNIVVMEEHLQVIKVSILKNRGLILNKNRESLGRFFGYNTLSFSNVEYINQLMPQFIGQKHNNIIENYILRGYSLFFSIAQDVYIQRCNGYLQVAKLKLSNIIENNSDYVVNGSLQKVRQGSSFILFDSWGRILGLSEEAFNILNDPDQPYEKNLSVEQIVGNYYIQFWIPNLSKILKEEQKFLNVQDNLNIGQVRQSRITINVNPQKMLQKYQQEFSQYLSLDTYRKKSTSKFSKIASSNTITQSNKEEGYQYLKTEECEIRGHKVGVLNQEYLERYENFYNTCLNEDFDQDIEKKSLFIKFQIKIFSSGLKNENFFFILDIIDTKNANVKGFNDFQTSNGLSLYNGYKLPLAPSPISQQTELVQCESISRVSEGSGLKFPAQESIFKKENFCAENYLKLDRDDKDIKAEQIKIFNQINNTNNNNQDNENSQQNHQYLFQKTFNINIKEKQQPETKEQPNQSQTFLKEISGFMVSPRDPKSQLLDKKVQIQELDQLQEIENFDEEAQENKFSSVKYQNKEDEHREIAEIINENKQNQDDDIKHGKNSVTSVSSNKTQNSVFRMIQNLAFSHQTPKSLIKILLYVIFLCLILVIIISIHLNIYLGSSDLLYNKLQSIVVPVQFNAMMARFTVFIQMTIDRIFGLRQFDAYFETALQNELIKQRQIQIQLLNSLKVNFATIADTHELKYIHLTLISGDQWTKIQNDIFYLIALINQASFRLMTYSQNNLTEIEDRDMDNMLFLKNNMIEVQNLMQDLMNKCSNDFFNQITSNGNLWIMMLLLEILVLVIFIPIQIPLWKSPTLHQQKILMLISRTQQKDIEDSLEKYRDIQVYLSKENSKWKQMNFSKISFDYFMKRSKTRSVNQKEKDIKKAKIKIMDTNFSYYSLYIGVGLFLLLFCGYLITGYAYNKENRNNSKSEFTLTMNFMKFKFNYDVICAQLYLIKSEPLFNHYINNNTQYYYGSANELFEKFSTEIVKELQYNLNSVNILYDAILQDILISKRITDQEKSLLQSLYSSDFCQFLAKQLHFCSLDSQNKFEYFPTLPSPEPLDNYRDFIKYGISGYVSQYTIIFHLIIFNRINKIITQYYQKELSTSVLVQDEEDLFQFFKTAAFQSFIQPYYNQLYHPIILFRDTMLSISERILINDTEALIIYYIVTLFAIICLILFITVWRLKKIYFSMLAARQSLVILPIVTLQNPQTVNQLKNIEKD